MLASGASIVVDLKHLAMMSTDYFYSQKLELKGEGGNYEDGNTGMGGWGGACTLCSSQVWPVGPQPHAV